MKMYFKGTSGITEPIDFNGEVIKEGDVLTFDYFGNSGHDLSNRTKEQINKHFNIPTYMVKLSDKGFYAIGVDKDLYLHDFRFKYCKIIKQD